MGLALSLARIPPRLPSSLTPLVKVKVGLFVTYTIIQSTISSEMQGFFEEKYSKQEEREEEKNNPQTMLLGEYSVRAGKTPQQKAHNTP